MGVNAGTSEIRPKPLDKCWRLSKVFQADLNPRDAPVQLAFFYRVKSITNQVLYQHHINEGAFDYGNVLGRGFSGLGGFVGYNP